MDSFEGEEDEMKKIKKCWQESLVILLLKSFYYNMIWLREIVGFHQQ